MKLLVKFEIKFLNFFTLKNLNNKKIYFLLPKNIFYTYRSKITNFNLVVYYLHNRRGIRTTEALKIAKKIKLNNKHVITQHKAKSNY